MCNICRLIRCHEEAVHAIAFSPDSNILLTACTLGNIRLNTIDVDCDNFILGGNFFFNFVNNFNSMQ